MLKFVVYKNGAKWKALRYEGCSVSLLHCSELIRHSDSDFVFITTKGEDVTAEFLVSILRARESLLPEIDLVRVIRGGGLSNYVSSLE